MQTFHSVTMTILDQNAEASLSTVPTDIAFIQVWDTPDQFTSKGRAPAQHSRQRRLSRVLDYVTCSSHINDATSAIAQAFHLCKGRTFQATRSLPAVRSYRPITRNGIGIVKYARSKPWSKIDSYQPIRTQLNTKATHTVANNTAPEYL